jgi:hypothetical protein
MKPFRLIKHARGPAKQGKEFCRRNFPFQQTWQGEYYPIDLLQQRPRGRAAPRYRIASTTTARGHGDAKLMMPEMNRFDRADDNVLRWNGGSLMASLLPVVEAHRISSLARYLPAFQLA